MAESIIVKKFDTGFTQIANCVLNDPRLSPKAKGVYCYLMAKPENWEFFTANMEKELGLSFRQIRSILQEIEQYGLIKRFQKNQDGSFGCVVYEFINPTDIHKTPSTQKCVDGKIDRQIYNNISNNTENRDIYNNNNNIYNCCESKKPTTVKKKDEQIVGLVDLLKLRIEDRYKRKLPTISGWYDQMRLLVEHDKVEPDRIIEVMNWHFSNMNRPYCHVILSARAFREKFVSIETQMKKNEQPLFEF